MVQKVAILGFAAEGQSAYEYWTGLGTEVTICDQNSSLEVPSGVTTQLGSDYLKGLDQFDLLVRTPALHPRAVVAANPDVPDILAKVTSVTNEFIQVCPSRNIIGITGTKGKGTTSTLTAKMLEAAGKRVHLGGNIGLPVLELLKNDIQPDDWVVLELSSFQLIDLKTSPHIAVCLMVVPEHMDWHEDMEEYIAAKQQLFIHQKPDDIAIYNIKNDNSLSIADATEGQLIPYMQVPGAVVENGIIKIADAEVVATADLKLLGQHNWENVCAAVTAVWQVAQNVDGMREVLTTFSGLEHRLEFVREVDGVKYYDDSFGTTPETAIVAIEAFKAPKVVILGGSDKGASYDELAKTVANNDVRTVVAIGDQGPRISEALKKADYTNIVKGGTTMTEIVATAKAQAQAGDVVLLSTGCASYDMFANYKDRGNQFKQAVQSLV